MAAVTGVGGIFFKCEDPEGLAAWYKEYLGFDIGDWPGAIFPIGGEQGPQPHIVWSPFKDDTDYFKPSQAGFMINFRVDDVEGVLDKARKGGAEIVGGIDEYSYGRFGWFIDPAGVKIELWQPLEGEPAA